ncbi:nucleotidyltransferase substrate binding protein [Blautia schinkii]|nr:nucleotidyltransferase substrate binding protein [Blautia schinkii]
MEEKYYKRYESFKRSLAALSEARERDMTDSFVLSGTGAKFSITLDLSWKVMKDIIIQHYNITDFVSGSPREVMRKAFKTQLIEGDIWLEMLKVRNELAHDYDGDIIKAGCKKIAGCYLDKFYEFQECVDKLMKTAEWDS